MKEFFVLPSFLDLCCEANSCQLLSGEHEKKTARKIIDFQSRTWVCTSSTSRGFMNLAATLNQCVAPGLYRGPQYDNDTPGYQGLQFTCLHFMNLRWSEPGKFVFNGHEIRIKIVDPSEKNLYRAMR